MTFEFPSPNKFLLKPSVPAEREEGRAGIPLLSPAAAPLVRLTETDFPAHTQNL